MRVLVTGLAGFTGSYVAAELRRHGHEVYGLALDAPSVEPEAARQVDLLDREAVVEAVHAIRPQAVIHLAAISFVAHGDADAIYGTNIVGTRNLLGALESLPHPPSVVVLASSASVYGNGERSGRALTEESLPRPANDYGVSKLAMEHMARLWADRLPLLFTRPFNYTGVGQSPRFLIAKIVDHFRRGERRIELGNLDVSRPFMDVRDVAAIYRMLLETEGCGDTFNLCAPSSHSLREVVSMMQTIAGYAIDVSVDPGLVRADEVWRLEGDGSRLERRLGQVPHRPLLETLRWMYEA